MGTHAKPVPVAIPAPDAKLVAKALALWEDDEATARAILRGLSRAAQRALVAAPAAQVIETGLAAMPPLKRIACRTALNTAPKLRAEVTALVRAAQDEMRAALTSQDQTAKAAQ